MTSDRAPVPCPEHPAFVLGWGVRMPGDEDEAERDRGHAGRHLRAWCAGCQVVSDEPVLMVVATPEGDLVRFYATRDPLASVRWMTSLGLLPVVAVADPTGLLARAVNEDLGHLAALGVAEDRGLPEWHEWLWLDQGAVDVVRRLIAGEDPREVSPRYLHALRVEAERLRLAQEHRLKRLNVDVDGEEGRRKFSTFFKLSWPSRHGGQRLEWNWHLDAICDHAQAVFEGWWGQYADPGRAGVPLWVQDFDFNLPPISLKSEILMVTFQAWVWLHEPRAQFGMISGNKDNVTRDSNACRDLVQSEWYRETFAIDWEIRSDVDGVPIWETTAGGKRTSRPLHATAVGLHVDFLICDDPDDPAQIYSEAAHKDVDNRWSALGSRLNDLRRSCRMIVQQNLHPKDLTTKRAAMGVPCLKIRGEWKPKKPPKPTPWGWTDPRVGAPAGTRMHPARMTDAVMAAERVRLKIPARFEAEINQDPENEGGSMFRGEWLRFFRLEDTPLATEPRPEGCRSREESPAVVIPRRSRRAPTDSTSAGWVFDRVVITVDATFGSIRDTASRVGLLAVGLLGVDRYIIDDRTKRMAPDEMLVEIIAITKAHGAEEVIVEDKANGPAIVSLLKSTISGLRTVSPEGGKETRAHAMQPAIHAGNVYVLDGAAWLTKGRDEDDEGLVIEICKFPNAPKDDRVDALSQLMIEFAPGPPGVGDVTPEEMAKALGARAWAFGGGLGAFPRR